MKENIIERYLLNLLSEEERSSFEKQMQSDEKLAEEVSLQRSIIEDIEDLGRLELKSQLKEIHNQLYSKKEQKNSSVRTIILRFAAAAVFVGVLAGALWMMQQQPSNADLFVQHFEPYALSLNQRSDTNQEFENIERLYSSEKYTEVIPLLEEELNNSNQKSSQLMLGLGISYMQANQNEKAKKQFEAIIERKDFNFEDEARWYLALVSLKSDDISQAREYLEILSSDTKRDHHKEAKTLLSKLKK